MDFTILEFQRLIYERCYMKVDETVKFMKIYTMRSSKECDCQIWTNVPKSVDVQ